MGRVRLLLQRPSDISDGSGGYTRDWEDVGFIWSKFKKNSGSAGAYEGKINQFNSCVVDLYHVDKSALKVGWRMKDGSRYWEIISIYWRDGKTTEVTLRSSLSDEI